MKAIETIAYVIVLYFKVAIGLFLISTYLYLGLGLTGQFGLLGFIAYMVLTGIAIFAFRVGKKEAESLK
jgi:hypothetical protein